MNTTRTTLAALGLTLLMTTAGCSSETVSDEDSASGSGAATGTIRVEPCRVSFSGKRAAYAAEGKSYPSTLPKDEITKCSQGGVDGKALFLRIAPPGTSWSKQNSDAKLSISDVNATELRLDDYAPGSHVYAQIGEGGISSAEDYTLEQLEAAKSCTVTFKGEWEGSSAGGYSTSVSLRCQ